MVSDKPKLIIKVRDDIRSGWNNAVKYKDAIECRLVSNLTQSYGKTSQIN